MISSKTLWDRDNRNNGISGAIRLGDKTKKGRSVGTYYSEWYGFEVASKRHLMDLIMPYVFSFMKCKTENIEHFIIISHLGKR